MCMHGIYDSYAILRHKILRPCLQPERRRLDCALIARSRLATKNILFYFAGCVRRALQGEYNITPRLYRTYHVVLGTCLFVVGEVPRRAPLSPSAGCARYESPNRMSRILRLVSELTNRNRTGHFSLFLY